MFVILSSCCILFWCILFLARLLFISFVASFSHLSFLRKDLWFTLLSSPLPLFFCFLFYSRILPLYARTVLLRAHAMHINELLHLTETHWFTWVTSMNVRGRQPVVIHCMCVFSRVFVFRVHGVSLLRVWCVCVCAFRCSFFLCSTAACAPLCIFVINRCITAVLKDSFSRTLFL